MGNSFRHLLFFACSVMIGPLAHAHGGGEARVEFELESSSQPAAGKSELSFQLVDTSLNQTISDAELSISHERKLHVFLYDAALREFSHLHPEFRGGTWKTEINLPVNGKYFVWAQGDITLDKTEFKALTQIEILNGQPAWPTPPHLTETRIGVDGVSRIALDSKAIRSGRSTMLGLKFDRTDGSSVDITPYLGALAHIVAAPEDGDSLIHVHPMNGAKPDEGMLHVTFPAPGNYRIWIQYNDSGILRTIPLVVTAR